MLIDKEYPATHSMDTAWYCVDEEGNVGLFAIEENGPIPEEWEMGLEVNDVFWHDFSIVNKDGVRDLNLTSAQIESMLMPMEETDIWFEEKDESLIKGPDTGSSWVKENYYYIHNASWDEVIIKIDMTKLSILLEAASMDEDACDLISLSRKEGLFFVQFAYNKKGVEVLEKNKVVLAKYKAPQYKDLKWCKDSVKQIEENNHFPVFVYQEEFYPNDGPAKRMSYPTIPMKRSQLPRALREKITQLPIRFKEIEYIQLAEHVPVYVNSAYIYVGREPWLEIRSSKNEIVYYGEESDRILTKEELDELSKHRIEENG